MWGNLVEDCTGLTAAVRWAVNTMAFLGTDNRQLSLWGGEADKIAADECKRTAVWLINVRRHMCNGSRGPHMINPPCVRVKLLDVTASSNKTWLTSNKGAYTRPNRTHLFERREKRRMRHHVTKHRQRNAPNSTEYVNIWSHKTSLTVK